MKIFTKKYLVPFGFIFASVGMLCAATVTISTIDPVDAEWPDLPWPGGTFPASTDEVVIDISNATANVFIRNGLNINTGKFTIGASTKLYIGGTSAGSLTIASGSAFDIRNNSLLTIGTGGSLTLSGGAKVTFFGNNDASRTSLLVDGGTLSSGITVGGGTKVEFKNGAVYNKNSNNNSIEMIGESNISFTGSTLNGYNVYDGNTGWSGNMFFVTSDGGSKKTITINNSVINGGGSSTGTYFDFNNPNLSNLTNGIAITLGWNAFSGTDQFVSFEAINGSKISASNISIGGQTVSGSSMGSINWTQSGTVGNRTVVYASGSLYLRLSNDTSGAPNTYSTNMTMAGNTSMTVKSSLTMGDASSLGGSANLKIINDANLLDIKGDLNVNAGNGNYSGLNSEASVNIYLGKDAVGNTATNSSFLVAGNINLTAGADTNILLQVAGATNSLTQTMSQNFRFTNSNVLGGTYQTKALFTDGSTSTVGRITFNEGNVVNSSGTNILEVSNGATLYTRGVVFNNQNTVAEATGKSHLIIDSATFINNNTDNFDYNAGGASSGEAGIFMKGSNSLLLTQGALNMGGTNVNTYGGTFKINIQGISNTFNVYKDLNMNGQIHGDARYELKMSGEGNTLLIGSSGSNWNTTNSDSSGGTNYYEFIGSNASNKNRILLGSATESGSRTINLHTSTVDGATTSTYFLLGGNTILKCAGTGGVNILIAEYGGRVYKGGTSQFVVRGAGNELYAANLIAGNTAATGGQGILTINGSGSHIEASNQFKIQGGVGTSTSSVVGGKLELKLDNDGISKIITTSNNKGNYNFSGVLEVDFSAITATFDTTQQYLLFDTSLAFSDLESLLFEKWFEFIDGKYAGNDNYVTVITRDATDIYEFYVVGDSYGSQLWLSYYSLVPEPTTWAAMFGAISLAFAAYRKKRN